MLPPPPASILDEMRLASAAMLLARSAEGLMGLPIQKMLNFSDAGMMAFYVGVAVNLPLVRRALKIIANG